MKVPEKPPDVRKIGEEKRLLVSEYFNNEEVGAFIEKANAEYWYWSDVKYHAPADRDREVLWLLVKNSREYAARRINISGFDFRYIIQDSMLKKLHELDMSAGGVVETTNIIPADYANRFLMGALMEESIASSQLEGAATTRKAAKEMLRSERKPANRSEQMILNNYKTIQKITALKDAPLTPNLLLELHRMITADTLENKDDEGRFRQTDDVYVQDKLTGDILHVPPEASNVPRIMETLCNFANDDGAFIHPIVKAIMLHFMVGYVHPFIDGNGRTARAVFYWYMISRGYWLLQYISVSRAIIKDRVPYAMAYLHTEKDGNDLTYFINYNLDVLDLALQDMKRYVATKIKDIERSVKIGFIVGMNYRQRMLLDELSKDPKRAISIKEVVNTFKVVYQTARTDLMGLEKRGFVQKKAVGKKKLVFFRSDDFETRLAASGKKSLEPD